jgi:hypothetical protein
MEEKCILVGGVHKEIKNIKAARKEYYFKPPSFLLSLLTASIKDGRDLPML